VTNSSSLKPGWKTWRFDQIAINVNDRIDDPSKAGVEYYVGLEHLDPDSLKIRRWGKPDDVEATKLCFKKGDIIFARRRAYQRKLGVAEFDGICSAHAMVLRPRTDVVLPEFLPLFIQSDLFMQRAVEISVGSLSPTINWKTLAVQQFVLPPLTEQQRIAEQLRTMNALKDAMMESELSAKVLIGSMLEELGKRTVLEKVKLEQASELITDGDHNPPKRLPNGIPHLVVANISSDGEYSYDGCTFISADDFTRVKKRYAPKTGDIIITCVGSVGRVAMVDSRTEFSADRSLAIVRPATGKLLPEYGLYLMQSPQVQQQFTRSSIGTAQAHLYLKELRNIEIALPSVREQEKQLVILREIKAALLLLRRRIIGVDSLRKASLNWITGAV
jgi:type I restriction enzyme S subunit